MHIFLTGAVGCGKSTVIRKVLARIPGPVGGFCTGFGPRRGETRRALYLWPAGEEPIRDDSHTVAQFDAQGPTPLPARFDALGCAALFCPEVTLLVMDECGRLEQEARQFQAAVLRALDGTVPVLGVVREGAPGWTAAIGAHPNVTLLEVTAENRADLAEHILLKLNP